MPNTVVRARLLARGLRTAQGSIRYARPVRPRAAWGLVAKVHQQIERDDASLAPPITLHSPAPEVMAASWLMMCETLLASGRADRVIKEYSAGARSLPLHVRDPVHTRLSGDAVGIGLSRSWVDHAVAELPG